MFIAIEHNIQDPEKFQECAEDISRYWENKQLGCLAKFFLEEGLSVQLT